MKVNQNFCDAEGVIPSVIPLKVSRMPTKRPVSRYSNNTISICELLLPINKTM